MVWTRVGSPSTCRWWPRDFGGCFALCYSQFDVGARTFVSVGRARLSGNKWSECSYCQDFLICFFVYENWIFGWGIDIDTDCALDTICPWTKTSDRSSYHTSRCSGHTRWYSEYHRVQSIFGKGVVRVIRVRQSSGDGLEKGGQGRVSN